MTVLINGTVMNGSVLIHGGMSPAQ